MKCKLKFSIFGMLILQIVALYSDYSYGWMWGERERKFIGRSSGNKNHERIQAPAVPPSEQNLTRATLNASLLASPLQNERLEEILREWTGSMQRELLSKFLELVERQGVKVGNCPETKPPDTVNHYTVTGKLTENPDADREDVYFLDLCVRANATSSGQVILVAKLLRGFEFEKEEVEALVGNYTARRGYENVKRIEVKEKMTQVSIYFDRLDANQQCLKLQVYKYLLIVSRQKGVVSVTDYYNPIHTTTSDITIDKVTTVCQLWFS